MSQKSCPVCFGLDTCLLSLFQERLKTGLLKLICHDNLIWKISKLPNSLEELDCSNNRIEGEFYFVSSLTNVYIQNNKIESLNYLANCSKLKILITHYKANT